MHPVVLRGLGAGARTGGPLIVQRADEDFVAAALDEARDAALGALLAARAVDHDPAGTLRLFQPVHRIFHLAMFEVVCDIPGQPRLDPAAIESAGMVVRRVGSARGSGAFGEGWMTGASGAVGWRRLASTARTLVDPEAARRHLPDQGHDAINARVRALVDSDGLDEDIETLFVAPPEVCAAAGRTIVFGVVPTVSSATGLPLAGADAPYDDDEIAAQVPRFLRAGKPASLSALAGGVYTFEEADALAATAAARLTPAALDDAEPVATDALLASKQMYGFVAMLKVLAIQLDAFGDNPEAKKLVDALGGITLAFADGSARTAADFLAEAVDVLVMSPGAGKLLALPIAWPEVGGRTATAIRTAFGKLLQARFAAFAPRATRFDDPAGRYRIHGFVRVRHDDDCPPSLIWAEPSPPYAIAPWYDTSATPPVLVRLPPITRKNVGKVKPNVAFVVPRGLFNLLNRNKPKDLIDGAGQDGGDDGVDWICGFNIPIITMVAFIVLYIFLTLLNIIFFWLPFVRICFPIPKKMPELAP